MDISRISPWLLLLFALLLTDAVSNMANVGHSAGDGDHEKFRLRPPSDAGKQHLLDIVLQDYDIDKWPTFPKDEIESDFTEATRANISLDIMFISSIDVQAMDLTIDFYLNQRWEDSRLQYRENLSKRPIVLRTVEQIKRIWTPDTYMVNAKSANFHEVTTPNRLVYIQHNGSVMYSARITAKLACEMHFGMYPVDTQVCILHLASYAYQVSHLKFHWRDVDPITYGSTEDLNQFTLSDKWTTECLDKYPDGDYPCLKVHFKFKRNFGHHLIQTYLPTVLIVTISWVSFFLEASAVPARVSLGITTFLTMITLNSGAKVGLPPVSYVKAIDIWMLACTFFVFSTLWHFVWVCVMARRPMPPGMSRPSASLSSAAAVNSDRFPYRKATLINGGSSDAQLHELTKLNNPHHGSPEFHHAGYQKERSDSNVSDPIWIMRADQTRVGQRRERGDFETGTPVQNCVGTPSHPNPVMPRKKKVCHRCASFFAPPVSAKDRAKKIDLFARWMYPLVFLLFNVVYWGYYLNLNPDRKTDKPPA